MGHRDFTNTEAKPGPSFTLAEHTFQCRSRLALATTMTHIKQMNVIAKREGTEATTDVLDGVVESLDTVIGFIKGALLAADRQVFAEMVESTDVEIDEKQIFEIHAWLMEEYADRPTVPSSSSEDGRSSTDTPSTDDAPSPVSILPTRISAEA